MLKFNVVQENLKFEITTIDVFLGYVLPKILLNFFVFSWKILTWTYIKRKFSLRGFGHYPIGKLGFKTAEYKEDLINTNWNSQSLHISFNNKLNITIFPKSSDSFDYLLTKIAIRFELGIESPLMNDSEGLKTFIKMGS